MPNYLWLSGGPMVRTDELRICRQCGLACDRWKDQPDGACCYPCYASVLEAALARAEEYAKALEMLAEGQEKLLVAYRLGAGPQTARTAIKGADMVREAKERLALLARGAEGAGDA